MDFYMSGDERTADIHYRDIYGKEQQDGRILYQSARAAQYRLSARQRLRGYRLRITVVLKGAGAVGGNIYRRPYINHRIHGDKLFLENKSSHSFYSGVVNDINHNL